VASPQGVPREPLSLLEAAGNVLRSQTNGPSMRLSSLVSALYELSALYKDEIKNAGGAKTWLEKHSDEFFLDTDCAPGHESVTLCAPLPPPPAAAAARLAKATVRESGTKHHGGDGDAEGAHDYHLNGNGGHGRNAHDDVPEGHPHNLASDAMHFRMLPRVPISAPERVPTNGAAHLGGSAHLGAAAAQAEGVEEEPISAPRPFVNDDELPEAQSCSLSWDGANGRAAADAADDAAAAALLGASSEEATKDPLLIEKKIRAVQKKLRRVQTIEQQSGSDSSALDAGQQVLLASKPRLQKQLSTLLEQWAVLEPALLEKQEQQLLAIANSECAICLEEYSADNQGIRTSCCGYHFHVTCLQQCIDSTGHCPICAAPKGQCKVVQQRRAAGGS